MFVNADVFNGAKFDYINTDTGHGVVYQGQPVLNANDHAKDVNLTHYGDCKSKLIFEEAKKQADEKYKAEEGDGFFAKIGKAVAKTVTKAVLDIKATFASNKCELETPLPWIFASRDHMIDGAPALTMESQCACKFGGIITVVPQEEAADESGSEVVEVDENAVPLAATVGKSASDTATTAALAAAAAGIAASAGMPGAAAGVGLAGAAKAGAANKKSEQSDKGEKTTEVDEYVTADQLKSFGWNNTSDKEVAALNATLKNYGITSRESITLFLATCGHESGKGSNSLEKLKKDGTTIGNYNKNERGAGYIQITWKDTHQKFLKTVNDSFNGEDTATYICNNYPWEAAGWFWTTEEAKKTSAGSLNDYAKKNGSSKGVFLVTQYLVNGWADGLTTELATGIRDGKVSWKIKNNKLNVDNKIICDAPIGWEDREKNYNDAINCFI